MTTTHLPDLDIQHGASNRAIDSRADPMKQSLRVTKLDESIKLSGREKLAGLVTILMMLGPLAAAAWGAHFGSL